MRLNEFQGFLTSFSCLISILLSSEEPATMFCAKSHFSIAFQGLMWGNSLANYPPFYETENYVDINSVRNLFLLLCEKSHSKHECLYVKFYVCFVPCLIDSLCTRTMDNIFSVTNGRVAESEEILRADQWAYGYSAALQSRNDPPYSQVYCRHA